MEPFSAAALNMAQGDLMLYKAIAALLGLSGLALIALKLLGLIPWPWLWVLFPVWVALCLLALLLSYVAVLLIFSWITGRSNIP